MALTVFWAGVTGGRILFAAVGKWCPPDWIFRSLPLLLALAFVGAAADSRGQGVLGLVTFGIAGLGCSALLPLVISFAQKQLTTMGTAVAGGLIGCYQIGYGIGAFGVGPLQTWKHVSLGTMYGWMVVIALALEILAVVIVARR